MKKRAAWIQGFNWYELGVNEAFFQFYTLIRICLKVHGGNKTYKIDIFCVQLVQLFGF